MVLISPHTQSLTSRGMVKGGAGVTVFSMEQGDAPRVSRSCLIDASVMR